MKESIADLRFLSTSHGTACIGTLCSQCKNQAAKFSSFGKHPDICFYNDTNTCHKGMPFYFFSQRDRATTAIFAKGRIPFQLPNANIEELTELKQDLVSALKALQPLGDTVLYARYGTTDASKGFFDVENVLFYNVGTNHFKHLARNRVIFESVAASEIIARQEQWGIPKEYPHYYEYAVIKPPDKLLPTGKILAEWDPIPFCKCTGLKPSHVWNGIKASSDKVSVFDSINSESGDCFSLVLKLEKPKNARLNIMTAMKPLLDGLICAFHGSNFERQEIVYFSEKLCCSEEAITSNALNILGTRQGKYIQIYRSNVKWNPADDRCHYVDISVAEGSAWRLSGKVCSLPNKM